MKVFISWSGPRSKAVAELLSSWIRCVLQAVKPWISTRDIDRGAVWFGEINDQLKETLVGIVCLTQENKNKPWILFEAGALAKGLSTSRVCTFLVDLEPRDIEDPLAQFNHTIPEKTSMLGLVATLNSALGDAGLEERVLDQVFETYWPQFDKKFKDALAENPPAGLASPRSSVEVMSEILENTRQMNAAIRRLEGRIPPRVSGGLMRQPIQRPLMPDLEAMRTELIERLLRLNVTDEKMVEIIAGSGDSREREAILQEVLERRKRSSGES